MYKVEILSDRIEQDSINRRRQLDHERKERIFNPKLRVMGIDTEALHNQIILKKQLSDRDREREENFIKQTKLNSMILSAVDEKVKQNKRLELEKLNLYRKEHQCAKNGKDYDLQDPNYLKNQLPSDSIGVSSLQKFDGEDLEYSARQKLQKEEVKSWTEKSLNEKEIERQKQANEQEKYYNYQVAIDRKRNALQNAVDQNRKNQARKDAEFNMALHKEKLERQRLEKERDMELSIKEINSQVNGVFLTESPDVFNIRHGHSVRVDVFKGFNESQREEIKSIQKLQIEEQQRLEQERRREEKMWDMQAKANSRAMELLEREKGRKLKQNLIDLKRENQIKAVYDVERNVKLNQRLKDNFPRQEFFNQFNTTSR